MGRSQSGPKKTFEITGTITKHRCNLKLGQFSYFYETGKVVLVISDADLERLLDQWEEDDEPLPPDELPEGHPDRPQPQMDLR